MLQAPERLLNLCAFHDLHAFRPTAGGGHRSSGHLGL